MLSAVPTTMRTQPLMVVRVTFTADIVMVIIIINNYYHYLAKQGHTNTNLR